MTAPPARTREKNFLWWTIIAATVAISVTVIPSAKDPFRIPKELEFRALGILVLATAVFAGGWRSFIRKWIREVSLATAICVWTVVATFFSLNRAISLDTLLTVVCGAAIFLATCATAEKRSPALLIFVFAAALVNALILISQATGIWNPFHYGRNLMETALLGNRNDAGAYLTAPAIAGFVIAGVTSGGRRTAYTVGAVGLLAGLVAAQTLSAIIAYVAAVAAFCVVAERRFLKPVAVAMVIVAIGAAGTLLRRDATGSAIFARVRSKAAALVTGNIDLLVTERVGPFLSAWQMFMKHPIAGVGPGVFRFEYFLQRLEVEQRYVTVLSPYAARENFGEVHNDHLQVLAETGLVGYALFAAALLYVASFSFRTAEHADQQGTALIARHLALPLTCGYVVLALGQFPVELAAPRLMFIFFGAVCCAWGQG